MVFFAKFGINCTSRFGECNFSILKNSQVQINSKLNEKNCMITYYWYKHEKIQAEKVPEDVSWNHFFCIQENFLRVSVRNFCHCFTWYHWPTNFFLSANHIFELWYVIYTGFHFLHRCYTFCTGVTLELHCYQPIRIKYFFMCIIIPEMKCNSINTYMLLAGWEVHIVNNCDLGLEAFWSLWSQFFTIRTDPYKWVLFMQLCHWISLRAVFKQIIRTSKNTNEQTSG